MTPEDAVNEHAKQVAVLDGYEGAGGKLKERLLRDHFASKLVITKDKYGHETHTLVPNFGHWWRWCMLGKHMERKGPGMTGHGDRDDDDFDVNSDVWGWRAADCSPDQIRREAEAVNDEFERQVPLLRPGADRHRLFYRNAYPTRCCPSF
jgi:hypothetical protein